MRVPAVVGSFPEPFRSGARGQEAADQARLPRPRGPLVRRGRDAAARRRRAQHRPLEPRVLASARCCGSSSGAGRDVRQDIAARQLEEGPEVSGVFAKPNAAGNEIELIDADGDVERTLGAGVRARRRRRLSGVPADLADHRHRRRRRRGGRRGADRGRPALPLRARDRGGQGRPAAARGAVTPLTPEPAARHPGGRRRRCGASRSARSRWSASTRRCCVAVLAVEALAALAGGLGRELRRTAAWGVPFALAVVVINALVTRDGATVFFRGANLPWPGQVDITLEAIAYGAVLGLRILAIFGTAVFLTAAVDADELLRGLRRVSLRSGVTAALAMRLFGVLRPRRAALRRRAALPAGRRRLAARGPARGHDRRAGPRDRRRGDARGARVRHRRPPAADAAPVVAPRLRVRRLGGRRCSRSRSACWPARGAQFEAYPRLVGAAHAGDADRDRRAVRVRAGAVRRPPRGRAMTLDDVDPTSSTLPLPGRGAGRARRACR